VYLFCCLCAVLANIKAAQQQNGLRHGDHQRYRKYCSRRLRRLRVGVGFTNPKRDFKMRPLEVSVVRDVRHLAIALVQAERAWAYAMQLKNDMTAETQRKRCHLLKRLGKAASWAALLEKLCAARADTRTQLQAEAYAAWLAGSVHFERNQHDKALSGFLHAKQVYEKLGSIGGAAMQLLCEERVASLQDSIRFSKYMQRHAKGGDAAGADDDDEDMSDLASSTNELLAAKLETLRLEKLSAQAQNLDTVTDRWTPTKAIPVSNDKLRMSFVEANNLRAQLDKALEAAHKQQQVAGAGAASASVAATSGKKGASAAASAAPASASGGDVDDEEPTNVLLLFQRLFSSYDDALKVLRDALLEPQQLEAHKQHLLSLRDYATAERLDVQLLRNRNFVANVVATLRDQEARPLAYQQRRLHKPDEVVLLYEKIAQCVQELLDLATAHKNASQVRMLTAQLAAARSLRVFYLAESYRRVRKFLEAFLLYTRALELADEFDKAAEAAAAKEQSPELAADQARVSELRRDAHARRGQVHAQALLEQAEKKAAGVASASVAEPAKQDKKAVSSLPLTSRLDNWDSGVPSEQHSLLEFPPSFQAAPAKPILFDLAFNAVNYPDVRARVAAAQARRSGAAAPVTAQAAPAKPAAAAAASAKPAAAPSKPAAASVAALRKQPVPQPEPEEEEEEEEESEDEEEEEESPAPAPKAKQPAAAAAAAAPAKKIAPPGESKAARAERERRAREEEERRIAAEEAAKKKQGWGFGGLLGKVLGR
jgi:signal recognition particle subunit SRP68